LAAITEKFAAAENPPKKNSASRKSAEKCVSRPQLPKNSAEGSNDNNNDAAYTQFLVAMSLCRI